MFRIEGIDSPCLLIKIHCHNMHNISLQAESFPIHAHWLGQHQILDTKKSDHNLGNYYWYVFVVWLHFMLTEKVSEFESRIYIDAEGRLTMLIFVSLLPFLLINIDWTRDKGFIHFIFHKCKEAVDWLFQTGLFTTQYTRDIVSINEYI